MRYVLGLWTEFFLYRSISDVLSTFGSAQKKGGFIKLTKSNTVVSQRGVYVSNSLAIYWHIIDGAMASRCWQCKFRVCSVLAYQHICDIGHTNAEICITLKCQCKNNVVVVCRWTSKFIYLFLKARNIGKVILTKMSLCSINCKKAINLNPCNF